MLIRFTVGNFLSFNEPQEFSMIGGKVRSKKEHLYEDDKISILKLASVFGANASGKSNLVNSIKFAQEVIRKEIPPDATNKYNRTDENNKSKPSYFDFEIKIKNKYYAYGFEIILNNMSVVNEWLHEIGSKEQIIFERNTSNSEIVISDSVDSKDKNILTTYAESIDTDNNILFLAEMNRNKEGMYKKYESLQFLEDIYNWFDKKLVINFPDQPLSPYSYFKNDEQKDEITKVLSSLGLGIQDYQLINENPDYLPKQIPKHFLKKIFSDLEKKGIKNEKEEPGKFKAGALLRNNSNLLFITYEPDKKDFTIQKLQFMHENKGIWFEINEESDGTRRMLDLIEILFAANSGSTHTFVIDEIDRSLHPQLTYRFIENYLKLIEKSNVQLIFTTHEAHILDLNLLRRDEIWFVDKNKNGESNIYSLEQYNERFDKKIEKAYLDGRYGGVPLFDEIFPMKVDDS